MNPFSVGALACTGRGASNESKIEEVISPDGEATGVGFDCLGGASKLSKIEDDISPDGEALVAVLGGAGVSYESKIEEAIWPLGAPDAGVGFAGAGSNPSNIDEVICPVFSELGFDLRACGGGASNWSKIDDVI